MGGGTWREAEGRGRVGGGVQDVCYRIGIGGRCGGKGWKVVEGKRGMWREWGLDRCGGKWRFSLHPLP